MTFDEFVGHMKGSTTAQVRHIVGDNDVVPLLHFGRPESEVHSIAFDAGWLEAGTAELVENLALPFIELMQPQYVAWTFTGRRGAGEGEWDHETAVALCIERERHETWLARLVRHDNTASLGAWRSWPANYQEGRMLTPIQEALR